MNPFTVMSKKKEKSIVQMEVEEELASAAKELEGGFPPASKVQKPDQHDIKDLFSEMIRQQAITNSQIVKSLQDTQKSGQAVVSAVQSLQHQ